MTRHLQAARSTSCTGLVDLPPVVRRPGERREPLPGLRVDEAFAQAAAERGLSLPTAVEMTLERALVAADINHVGEASLYAALLDHSGGQRVESPLPGPFGVYVRMIAHGRPRTLHPAELEQPFSIPLRFFPRVLRLSFDDALTAEGLADAVVLERAALCVGRTMSEYALVFACAFVPAEPRRCVQVMRQDAAFTRRR